jgi:hypothetical protein
MMKAMPLWIYNIFARFLTLGFLLLTFILFRAANARYAFKYIGEMFSRPFYQHSDNGLFIQYLFLPVLFVVLYVVEWMNRDANNIAPFFGKVKNVYLRYAVYLFLFVLIVVLGTFEKTAFIYFQF